MIKMMLNQLNASKDGSKFTVTLSNGSSIVVVEGPEEYDRIYCWKVGTQLFNNDIWAAEYLQRMVVEKLTGYRVIMHEEKAIPNICGVNGSACRRPDVFNSAICRTCPVKERANAEADGLQIIYAVNAAPN